MLRYGMADAQDNFSIFIEECGYSRPPVDHEYTIALQTPLDRAHGGELPSDILTLISHWEIFHGKIGEIWRSVVATYTDSNHFAVTQSSAILEH